MDITKRSIKIFIAFVLTISVALLASTNIEAQTYSEFGVKAKTPQNQLDTKVEYFDLVVKKDTKQTLYLKITNNGKKDMIANVSMHNATTTNNGGVIYNVDKQGDPSLKNPITNYMKVITPKLSIKANSSKYAKVEIDMKQTSFDGIILGGINVNADTKDEKKETSQAGISLDNRVSFVTAVKLNMNKKKIAKNLNLVETKGDLIDYKTAVSATIQNDRPILMKGATIEGEIFAKDSDKAITSVNLTSVNIAPNSNFKVVYDWNNKELKEGNYRIRMEARHGDDVWKWDEEFEIKDASKVNKEAWSLKDNLILIIGLSLGIIGLIILVVVILKRRKKDNE